MRTRVRNGATILPLCAAIALALALTSCAGDQPESYRVAVIGFEDDQLGAERNSLVEYGVRRIEAELGAEMDFFKPGSGGEVEDLFSESEDAYDMVVSVGQDSSLAMLAERPAGARKQCAALDFESTQPVRDERKISLVRYRVEEGAYICGYLAGWLTESSDHPLANARPDVAYIGAADDPLHVYYDGGFSLGVRAALPKPGIYRYTVTNATDSANARAYAEHAAAKGVDIIFCSPGPFNDEVLEVAREKNLLVILVGGDRYHESPEHVLTSLILRDDNALFEAVNEAMQGELKSGRMVWGKDYNIWSLAPFHGHDSYVRRELKEGLQRQMEELDEVDFTP
jgi:basic membrane lipoprotein Med (substrate-binding protein (PBP1-ABC) superfamily)